MFSKAVEKKRRKLFRFFVEVIDPLSTDTLLDIGGPTKAFSEVAACFAEIFVVNVANIQDLKQRIQICCCPDNIKMIRADGCNLPFKDKSVDFIFSNATLEHISKSKWFLLAEEVRRVARKGFFISVPNFWFPFEPHYLMPAFQFLPESIRHFLIVRLKLTIGHMTRENYHIISLGRKSTLRRIFPEAKILGFGFLPWFPFYWICWAKNP